MTSLQGIDIIGGSSSYAFRFFKSALQKNMEDGSSEVDLNYSTVVFDRFLTPFLPMQQKPTCDLFYPRGVLKVAGKSAFEEHYPTTFKAVTSLFFSLSHLFFFSRNISLSHPISLIRWGNISRDAILLRIIISDSLPSLCLSLVPFCSAAPASLQHVRKTKLMPILKKFLLIVFILLMIIPTSVKGSEVPGTRSDNMLGGFSRLGERRLFLQANHTETKAQSGATAALHCALSAPLADGLVSWIRRRDYHLLTVGRQVYSSDKRMGVKVSPDGNDWMLTIRWVTQSDAGHYECQVSSHPPQALMVDLTVVVAHAEIMGGRERYIHSGSSLQLVCLLRKATEPPVYVFWYRGDRMINYDNERGVMVDNSREASVLYVDSVTSHDEGNYTCVPSNASPASVTVHVVHKENPAGLQQETNTEKEANPASSNSASSAGAVVGSSSSSSASSSFSSSSSSTSSSSPSASFAGAVNLGGNGASSSISAVILCVILGQFFAIRLQGDKRLTEIGAIIRLRSKNSR